MTEDEFTAIADKIQFRNWSLFTTQKPPGCSDSDAVFLQWAWGEYDATKPFPRRWSPDAMEWQASRLLYIGDLPTLTEDEIVRGAWLLLQIAIEHETREWFRYGDSRPYDPHVSNLRASVR